MKIYELKRDFNYLGKINFIEHQRGAYQIPINSDIYEEAEGMITTRNIKLPGVIYFAADFNIIPEVDFPHNSLLINIFSMNMFSVLKGLGDFKYRTVPVIMFDHKEMEAYHIEEGELLEDLHRRNENYIALQLMEYAEAFDKEHSKYEEHFLDPMEVGYIEKLVLKNLGSSFPPIFNIKEDFTKLFITEQAKNALEAANIKGCEFEEVEVSG